MDIKQIGLYDILKNIENNQYDIPEFQRDFVWKPQSITFLLDSIFKNYPIGAFLILPSNNIKLNSTKLNFYCKLKENVKENYYVLDGQQRLTSIARSLLLGDIKNSFYLDIEKYCLYCISERQKIEKDKYIQGYSYNGDCLFESEKNKENVDLIIKNKKLIRVDLLRDSKYDNPNIFDLTNYLDIFFKQYNINPAYNNEIKNMIRNKISETFYSYKLIMQQLDQNETIEAICRIFETINSTGIKLTIFDLLVAKTFNINFNLKQTYEKIKNELEIIDLEQENFIHIILMAKQINNMNLPTLTKENLFNLKEEDFNEEIINSFKTSLNNYYEWKNTERIFKKLPSETIITLLLAIDIVRIKNKKHSIFKTSKQVIKNFIISRAFAVPNYNKSIIANDYKILKDLFNSENESSNYKYHLSELFKNCLVEPVTKNDILQTNNKSKLYAIVLTLLYSNIHKDLEANSYDNIINIEEHHIIPKRTCQKESINKIHMNSVANILLIDSTLNKKIYDKNPNIYFEDIIMKHKDIKIFKSYELLPISDNITKNFDKYEVFLEKRAEALADNVNEYLKVNNLLK